MEEAELGWVEAVLAAIVVPVALPEQVVEVLEQVEQVVVDGWKKVERTFVEVQFGQNFSYNKLVDNKQTCRKVSPSHLELALAV